MASNGADEGKTKKAPTCKPGSNAQVVHYLPLIFS